MSKTSKLKVPKRAPRPGEGRPSKYRPEYCQQMLDYFKSARDIFKKASFGSKGEKEYLEFPTFQGFAALELGVCTKTLQNWCDEDEQFLRTYETCREIQQQILVKGGLTRAYDSNFAKFILNSVSDTFKDKPVELDATDEAKNLIRLGYALPGKAKNE